MNAIDESPLVFVAYWIRPGPLALWVTPGIMRLADGRISFKTARGMAFDVPVGDLRNVSFPGWNQGTAVKFKVNGRRYRIAFTWRYDGQVPRTLTEEAGLPAEDWSGPPVKTAQERGKAVQQRLASR